MSLCTTRPASSTKRRVRFYDGARPVRDHHARRVERFQAPADDGLRLVVQGSGLAENPRAWRRKNAPLKGVMAAWKATLRKTLESIWAPFFGGLRIIGCRQSIWDASTAPREFTNNIFKEGKTMIDESKKIEKIEQEAKQAVQEVKTAELSEQDLDKVAGVKTYLESRSNLG